MSPDQIIALLTSFGALLAALAAFLTFRQLVKQREASYQPKLVISRTRISLKGTNNWIEM